MEIEKLASFTIDSDIEISRIHLCGLVEYSRSSIELIKGNPKLNSCNSFLMIKGD